MPSTVNGIGTSYFLKKKRCFSIGHCESCGNLSWLSDYTTYKCVCILFIPVIPYGKARVMGYCPACTRHRVTSHKNFSDAVAKTLQEAQQAWQADPTNTDALMALCDVLITTGQEDQIDELLRLTQATLSPDDEAIVNLRRLTAAKRGRAALDAYQALVAKHPERDVLVVEMLQLMTVMGLKKEIPRAVVAAFDANRDSVLFMANAGDLASYAKDFETATRCYDQMIALKPELASELRNNKAVRKAYKKARRPFPGDDVA